MGALKSEISHLRYASNGNPFPFGRTSLAWTSKIKMKSKSMNRIKSRIRSQPIMLHVQPVEVRSRELADLPA